MKERAKTKKKNVDTKTQREKVFFCHFQQKNNFLRFFYLKSFLLETQKLVFC